MREGKKDDITQSLKGTFTLVWGGVGWGWGLCRTLHSLSRGILYPALQCKYLRKFTFSAVLSPDMSKVRVRVRVRANVWDVQLLLKCDGGESGVKSRHSRSADRGGWK